MGWISEQLSGHEGYVVGLVPVEEAAAAAARSPELRGERLSEDQWYQYVESHGQPIWWRELSSEGPAGLPDEEQPVRQIQVACECGWRSQRFYAPSGTRCFPPGLVFPDETNMVGFEDYAQRVWQRHCEDTARAAREDVEMERGERCAVFGCTERRGHDGILGVHSKFATGVRKLYPAVGR